MSLNVFKIFIITFFKIKEQKEIGFIKQKTFIIIFILTKKNSCKKADLNLLLILLVLVVYYDKGIFIDPKDNRTARAIISCRDAQSQTCPLS